ncbi:MAG TPA: hypothetical protein VG410_10160 [Solirubrobacteraceae bacterium]|nr:hypothetical protein [Solirubrobacteraceae bacterium]
MKHARNIAIILLIAAAVDLLPGGGKAANTVLQAISLLFIGTLAWFASLMYRQHRVSLYALGDKRRAVLYASAGALLLVLSALYRVQGATAVLALVVAAVAIYAIFTIIWSARQY